MGGSADATNLTLALSDKALGSLPTSLVSGSVHPTEVASGDAFPAPASDPHGPASPSIFKGDDPNGTWKLFVVDNSGGDPGAIAGGWSLTITARVKR